MDNVIKYLKSILKSNDTIILAVSGGPDSLCLLHLLCNLDISLKLIVAHVNHKLRPESAEEALFVQNFCEEKKITFEYLEINDYNKDNLENAARNKRYQFFNTLVLKYQAKYLMTAHHGDDLIETILMRLTRGSSIKGYSGFKKEITLTNYKLIRPLITITKEDIITYMDNNNYKYYLDKSNFSKTLTRNRYRMDILPFLKNENHNVHLKFLEFSEKLAETTNFIDNYIKDIITNIKDENGLKISKLLTLDNFLLKKIIEYELSLIYLDNLYLVSDKNTNLILKMLKSKNSNETLNLPNNYLALKEYNYLKFVYNSECNSYEYVLDEYVKTPNGTIKIIKESSSKSNNILRLNSKDITLPLIVRSPKPGDKMAVKNLNGHQKIKDIFINEKVLKQKRKTYPVVLDSNNEILWLPGIKKSKFDIEKNSIYDIILAYEEEK